MKEKVRPTKQRMAVDIFEKYRYKCGYCLTQWAAGVHEIIPRSAGGKRVESNQIPLCKGCHEMIQANWRDYVDTLYAAQARAKRLFGTDIEIGGV